MGTAAIQNIIIIGTGRVARQLSPALFRSGMNILQVFGRDIKKAEAIARPCKARAVSSYHDLDAGADLIILCVSDQAISEIIDSIQIDNGLVVHTSGSVPIGVFSGHYKNYGVFYPLQTFSGDRKADFNEIPILIEANNPHNESLLTFLALKLSSRVQLVDSATRLAIHAAAVFANNFTNYIYIVAQDILKTANLDFDLLGPLIRETAEKALSKNPTDVQTGPALRNDRETIDRHLKLLENNKDYRHLYELLSEMIIKKYKT
jgi:predicted short-subunit dehydrogenase-like oxidoreductase (DUF2520 family)